MDRDRRVSSPPAAAGLPSNHLYLRHISDFFLDVFVGGRLLPDLVPKHRQCLLEGVRLPLGLGGGGGVREERGRKELPPPPTFWASAPVTATMRRMPLAMASSETMTKGEAWPEFCRWLQTTPTTAHRCEAPSPSFPALSQSSTHVPPQNSMEVREPAVLAGSWSSSSTGTPMDTTRTGSG